MGPREQIERAMDRLGEALERDEISTREYHAEMRDLRAEYRDAAAEAGRAEHDSWFQ